MSISRSGLMMASLSLLAVIAGAQTKAPAKKSSALAATNPMVVEPGSEKWGDIPATALVGTPSVEMGGTLKLAVIQGDPMTAGRTYTVHLSCTDGTKIAPHWHPARENVTVLKGGAAVGMGSKWDDKAMEDLPVGSFFTAPAQMRHYAQCKGETILQVHGIAPLIINFVTPDEAPAKK